MGIHECGHRIAPVHKISLYTEQSEGQQTQQTTTVTMKRLYSNLHNHLFPEKRRGLRRVLRGLRFCRDTESKGILNHSQHCEWDTKTGWQSGMEAGHPTAQGLSISTADNRNQWGRAISRGKRPLPLPLCPFHEISQGGLAAGYT